MSQSALELMWTHAALGSCSLQTIVLTGRCTAFLAAQQPFRDPAQSCLQIVAVTHLSIPEVDTQQALLSANLVQLTQNLNLAEGDPQCSLNQYLPL